MVLAKDEICLGDGHMGDLCCKGGKVFVGMNMGRAGGGWKKDDEVWQYDGESIRPRNKSGYTQIKHYGKDGTYVCVEFARKTSDKGETYVEVYPHEYGKPGYKLKNRMYIEMGRAPLKDAIVFLDKDTQRGRWGTRTDIWKRITLPKALLDHIITSARIHQERWSGTMQESMKKNLFE